MKASSQVTSLLQKALQWSFAQRSSMLAQQYETDIFSKRLFKTKPAVVFPVPFSDSSAPVVKKGMTEVAEE